MTNHLRLIQDEQIAIAHMLPPAVDVEVGVDKAQEFTTKPREATLSLGEEGLFALDFSQERPIVDERTRTRYRGVLEAPDGTREPADLTLSQRRSLGRRVVAKLAGKPTPGFFGTLQRTTYQKFEVQL